MGGRFEMMDRAARPADGLADRSLEFRGLSENKAAGAAFLLFFLAWMAIETILNADRTLHFDLAEAYAWGKEFQLGYNQHGPFWAWIAGAWFLVFPNTNTSFVLLEALNATLGLFGAWMLIGLFTKGWARGAATALLVATPFYTFNAYKYNANTIFISLWPWTLYFFIRSVDLMSRRDALFFGMFAAACILSKYYAAILLATCGLSLFFHPNGRRYLLSSLPWIAFAIFVLLVAPHVYWALTRDAPPVAYAMSLTGKGWQFTGQHIARFIVDLLLFQAAIAALLFLARFASRREGASDGNRLSPSRRRFLAVLVLAPPVMTILAAAIFQLKIEAVMMIGIFPLLPLLLMQWIAPRDSRRCFYLAGGAAAAVTLVTLVAAPFANSVMASKKEGPSVTFPYRELAASVTELWRAETHKPLKYFGSEARTANTVSFYSPDNPSSFVNLEYGRALWITPAKLEKDGLLIACVHEDAVCLDKASHFLGQNGKQSSLKIGRDIGARHLPDVTFDIFIIPPRAG